MTPGRVKHANLDQFRGRGLPPNTWNYNPLGGWCQAHPAIKDRLRLHDAAPDQRTWARQTTTFYNFVPPEKFDFTDSTPGVATFDRRGRQNMFQWAEYHTFYHDNKLPAGVSGGTLNGLKFQPVRFALLRLPLSTSAHRALHLRQRFALSLLPTAPIPPIPTL